jgi:hypothetical protein
MSQDVIPRPIFGIYIARDRASARYPAKAPPQPERTYLAVPRFHQERSLSCEMACLRMAAHYQTVARTEQELVRILPMDKTQPRFEDKKLIWADANRFFPGNSHGWQLYHGGMRQRPRRARRRLWGYGVYAPGIAEVATEIGLEAEVFDRVDHVYTALDKGHVPIVIVPGGGRSTSRKWHWYSPQGDLVPAINSEHAIAVVGYNERNVWVNDPLKKVSRYERIVFERAFALLSSGVAIGPPKKVVPVPDPPKRKSPWPWAWPWRWPFRRE